MGKVWKFHIPVVSSYASLLSHYIRPEVVNCKRCGESDWPQLRVEWEDGSDLIGDFTRASVRVVCRKSIGEALLEEFGGFTLEEIEMFDHPKLYAPSRPTKRTAKRVWLPYGGPELIEISALCRPAMTPASSVDIETICDRCGNPQFLEFLGIERYDSRGRKPREAGKGLYFNSSDLSSPIFRPRGTGMLLCTEAVRKFVQERECTNVMFLEVGDLI